MTHASCLLKPLHPNKAHPFTPIIFVILLAIALVTTTIPVQAKAINLRYEAYWGGFHIADFALTLINSKNTFENRFHLESRGLTRFFTNLSAKAVSQGRIIAAPPPTTGGANMSGLTTYIAQSYRTKYTNKRHERWVDISFGASGKPAQAVTGTAPVPGREDRWNPKEKGPETLDRVEPEFRIGVNDPITLVPQIMSVVKAHLKGGPASGIAKGFDGRRRFDMNITYMGPVRRTVAGVTYDTYRVRIVPTPVAGFKKRHKTLWNNAAYDFYLSRDGSFVPLQIVPVDQGPVLTLVSKCPKECDIIVE